MSFGGKLKKFNIHELAWLEPVAQTHKKNRTNTLLTIAGEQYLRALTSGLKCAIDKYVLYCALSYLS